MMKYFWTFTVTLLLEGLFALPTWAVQPSGTVENVNLTRVTCTNLTTKKSVRGTFDADGNWVCTGLRQNEGDLVKVLLRGKSTEGECFKEDVCSGAEICTTGTGCEGACFFTAAGNTRCFAGEFGCDQPACTTDADCAAGSACSNTCCGLQCVPLCGNPFPTTPAPAGGGSSSK